MQPTSRVLSSYLTTIITSLLVLSFVAACGDSDDDKPATTDTTAPSIVSTTPLDEDTEVALGGNLAVTFSEAMDPTTITEVTLTLKQGTKAIDGTVAYSGVTATFEPDSALETGTVYSATLTTGATDLAGNALDAAHTWSFTTGSVADTTAPMALTTVPTEGALDVSTSQDLSVTFSEAMRPDTLSTTTFTLTGPGSTSVDGLVTYAGTTATFAPLAELALDTLFVATVTTEATDLAGNALAANFEWSFTTAAGMDIPDTTAPMVVSTVPAEGELDVAANRGISVEFSEAMAPGTVTATTFTLKAPGAVSIDGMVTFSGTRATFVPLAFLPLDTLF